MTHAVNTHDLPADLLRLIRDLMSKSPESRPASASEVRERLERLLGSTPAARRPARLSARAARALFCALALALSAIAGFLVTVALL